MMTQKEIKQVARLARLGISRKEERKIEKELSSILELVEKLNQVKTDKMEPTAQVTGLLNVFRKDKGRKKTKSETDKLLALAPELKDRHIKVKAIF